MDIDKFIQSSKLDEDIEESLRDYLEDNGIYEDFNIDKSILKKLKTRSIKTDNGFSIKGNLSDFEDAMKFSIKVNDNDTCDLIIKVMLCILGINNKGDNMGNLKGKLNKLVETYGLNHEKVIEYSQYVDGFVVAD